MQYLLDTHTLLWFLEDDPQLPKKVSRELIDIRNKCYISIATLWEIAIKIKLGKLTTKFPFDKFSNYLSDNDIEILSISLEHLVRLLNIDLHHRDPFDRLIIAQGLVENLIIISKDQHFRSYTDKVFWK